MLRLLAVSLPCFLLCLSGAGADEKNASDNKTDSAAEKLMKDAHRARASWDAAFPGFTCKLVAVVDGKEATGKLTVEPDGKIKVDLPAGPINEWASHQLESLVSHRFAGDRGQYQVVFADEEANHPLGRLIKFTGAKNAYRIKGDVITEVHRAMGDGKFTISVTDVVRNAEGKYLPRSYNVSYWDGAGNLVRNEDYLEEHTRTEKVDLPIRRLQIRTGKNERIVSELRLSEHVLGPTKAATK